VHSGRMGVQPFAVYGRESAELICFISAIPPTATTAMELAASHPRRRHEANEPAQHAESDAELADDAAPTATKQRGQR
jgi:hypothetical protein